MQPNDTNKGRTIAAISCLGICVAFVFAVGLHFFGVLPLDLFESPLPYVLFVLMLACAVSSGVYRVIRLRGIAWEIAISVVAVLCMGFWALCQWFISFVLAA